MGQKFILLLSQHPMFELHAIGASARSTGKKYYEATRWKQVRPMPAEVRDMEVRECKAQNFEECDVVFSGLNSDVAGEIGMCIISLSFSQTQKLERNSFPSLPPPKK